MTEMFSSPLRKSYIISQIVPLNKQVLVKECYSDSLHYKQWLITKSKCQQSMDLINVRNSQIRKKFEFEVSFIIPFNTTSQL